MAANAAPVTPLGTAATLRAIPNAAGARDVASDATAFCVEAVCAVAVCAVPVRVVAVCPSAACALADPDPDRVSETLSPT